MNKRIKNKKIKKKNEIYKRIAAYEAQARIDYELGDRVSGDLCTATANGLYEALEIVKRLK